MDDFGKTQMLLKAQNVSSWGSNLFWVTAAIFLLYLLCFLFSSYFNRGLNRYPGPFLAKFTNFWHWLDVKSNKHHEHLLQLHRRHGDVVRIGPKTLSISRPDYVPLIYGTNPEYLKSETYDAFAQRINGKRTMSWGAARDPKDVNAIKKPIASAYSFSNVLQYQPLVDQVISKFMNRLHEEFICRKDRVCDMALWLRLFTNDVITQLTFSDNLGFLDKGRDIGDFLKSLDKAFDTLGLTMAMPWTTMLVKHNPIVGYFVKNNTIFPSFAQAQFHKRLTELDGKGTGSGDVASTEARARDFLDRFLDASRIPEPPGHNYYLLMEWTLVNILAGADTTAIGLRAMLYYLLKSPEKKAKLIKELLTAHLSIPVSWEESQRLPYLDACIREAYRLHPSIGFGLERVASGLTMPDGYVLPEGTNVSINSWIVNRQPLFGEVLDSFVPERWLQGDEETDVAFKERRNAWRRADLVFGGGSRSCTGKHIALLETYKLLPTLLLKYEIELRDPSEEWTVINRWAVRQENIKCLLRARKRS